MFFLPTPPQTLCFLLHICGSHIPGPLSFLIHIKQKLTFPCRNCSPCLTWQIGITSLGLRGNPTPFRRPLWRGTPPLRATSRRCTWHAERQCHSSRSRHKTEGAEMGHLLNCARGQLCSNLFEGKRRNRPQTTTMVFLIIFFKYKHV